MSMIKLFRAKGYEIGDWLTMGGKSGKVTAIDGKHGLIALTCMQGMMEQIEPIKLTVDMLYLNGFKRPLPHMKVYRYENRNAIIEIHFPNKDIFAVHLVSMDIDVQLRMHYVHELQHFMRLFFMYKEANNFRIE